MAFIRPVVLDGQSLKTRSLELEVPNEHGVDWEIYTHYLIVM